VVAANATRFYGDPNPVFTGTITGIKNADNITATYSSVADPTSAPGTYPIVPALVDPTGKLGNYTVTSTNGVLTVSPAPLVVTAANASRLYGDPNPAFTGTISGVKNGDTFGLSFSTVATATSGVGTYPIVPALTDPNNKLSNYAVTLNNGTLTINPAALTVTASNASRVYGDPNPTFAFTLSGFVNGETSAVVSGAPSCTSADPTAAVGTYPITCTVGTLTAANYTFATFVNGTLTVTPAPLSLVAANSTRAYGDPNNLSGTLTGVKNGDNITAVYSTTATATSAPGTYPITASLLDPTSKLGNYSVTITNATLTVTQAPLVVAAANASRLYGDPNPAFTGTITGLKNGDTIGAIFSAAADPTSPVGTYAIIPTVSDPNNVLSNYSVTLNNGVLTVNPAPLSVVAADSSRLYGDPNPAFTGTLTGIKNGDNITASFSSAADPTSPVGTYPIVPALADPTNKLANYVVTSTNGTLTVSPAPLTIQANDATAPVGGPFPTFTGTITGLKNTDVVTASYSTTADSTSPAGQYPIIPAADPSPALANYSVTLINGTLTLQ
jgi:hypothetical protein